MVIISLNWTSKADQNISSIFPLNIIFAPMAILKELFGKSEIINFLMIVFVIVNKLLNLSASKVLMIYICVTSPQVCSWSEEFVLTLSIFYSLLLWNRKTSFPRRVMYLFPYRSLGIFQSVPFCARLSLHFSEISKLIRVSMYLLVFLTEGAWWIIIRCMPL